MLGDVVDGVFVDGYLVWCYVDLVVFVEFVGG